ncbi:MAG: AMP-binding protein, partial [Deltaproteobacteria bacterium]|nr:AMP-binding protein [Deltaproteobacteria bacterium]
MRNIFPTSSPFATTQSPSPIWIFISEPTGSPTICSGRAYGRGTWWRSHAAAVIIEGREETRHLSDLLSERFPPARALAIDWPEAAWSHPYEEAIRSAAADDPGVEVKEKDPFLIMITSGTTGFPKACLVNHETYVIRSLNNAIIKAMNPETRALLTLPLHFNAGRGSMVGALYLGATVFIQERFKEEQFLATVEAEKISYTMLVPTLCDRLLQYADLNNYDRSSLQFIGITGGHLSPQEAEGM